MLIPLSGNRNRTGWLSVRKCAVQKLYVTTFNTNNLNDAEIQEVSDYILKLFTALKNLGDKT
jgi:hypothetical protein